MGLFFSIGKCVVLVEHISTVVLETKILYYRKQGWVQIRFFKYKYKYKYMFSDFSNTNTNTNTMTKIIQIQIQIQIRTFKYK